MHDKVKTPEFNIRDLKPQLSEAKLGDSLADFFTSITDQFSPLTGCDDPVLSDLQLGEPMALTAAQVEA